MPNFDDLKKQAELQMVQDKAAAQGWVKTHRAALILGAIVGIVVGFVLAKLL